MKRKNTRRIKRLRQPSLVGILAALSVTSGGLFAVLMGFSPFSNQIASSHLPNSPDSLTGVIPTNLDRPVNILVLGIDNSGHPHQGNFTPAESLAGNSDTILLVRLLPDSHKINILSIPRDTLVHLDGVGIDKINDANMRGGAKTAAAAVSQLLEGIPIDRYIRIDTEGFSNLVDALGGLEINVPKAMNYTDHTQKLSIHFAPGRQKLNGQHLQEYVRFRHDALGDIGRVQRQQEVLKQILQKMLRPETITKLPQILKVFKDNVDSDLSVGELLAIVQDVSKSDRHLLNLVMLPGRFSRKEEYHVSYWISNPQASHQVLARYFDVPGNTEQQADLNSSQFQTIRIGVANATQRRGAAARVVALLKQHGFSNTYILSRPIDFIAEEATHKTQIIAQNGDPNAANAVSGVLGAGQVQIASVGDIFSDVTVVVGPDLAGREFPQGNRRYLPRYHKKTR